MKVFCWCFVLLLLLLINVEVSLALKCLPCAEDIKCPSLPANCEPGRKPCGCCDECRGKEGDTCGSFSVPCEEGLFCVDQRGRYFLSTPWWTFTSDGVCTPVKAGTALCPCGPPPSWEEMLYQLLNR